MRQTINEINEFNLHELEKRKIKSMLVRLKW